MAKKASSRTSKSARRATANKAIAAASVKAAKVTKAVHLAIAKALPNAQVISPNVGGTPQLILGGPAPTPQGAKGPGTIEPKAFLVFVIPL